MAQIFQSNEKVNIKNQTEKTMNAVKRLESTAKRDL